MKGFEKSTHKNDNNNRVKNYNPDRRTAALEVNTCVISNQWSLSES